MTTEVMAGVCGGVRRWPWMSSSRCLRCKIESEWSSQAVVTWRTYATYLFSHHPILAAMVWIVSCGGRLVGIPVTIITVTSYRKNLNISYIIVEQKKEATYPFSRRPCSGGVGMPSSRAISWLYNMGLVMSNPRSISRSSGRRST